jgi:hypothetical protein
VAQDAAARALLDEAKAHRVYDGTVIDGWQPSLQEMLSEDLDHELLHSSRHDGFEDNEYGRVQPCRG